MPPPLLGFCCGLALLVSGAVAFAAEPSDRDMAERYSRAALAGNDEAQFYLGALYSAGIGLPQSDAEAINWFSRAAQQGHAQAMLVLGGHLAIGRGAPKDNIAAYKWAYIVAEGSRVHESRNGARQLLTLLELRMTPADVAQAKSEALRFRATTTQSGSATSIGSIPPPQPVAVSAPPPPALTAPPPPALSAPPPPALSAPPPPAPSAPQSAAASAPQPTPAPGPRTKQATERDHDVDRLLNRVPPGIRKRYGF